MGVGLVVDFIRNMLSIPFCPYHFVLEPCIGIYAFYGTYRIYAEICEGIDKYIYSLYMYYNEDI